MNKKRSEYFKWVSVLFDAKDSASILQESRPRVLPPRLEKKKKFKYVTPWVAIQYLLAAIMHVILQEQQNINIYEQAKL